MRALQHLPPGAKPPAVVSARQGQVAELLGRHLRLSTYLFFTLVTYFYAFPLDRAATIESGWMVEVLARNLAIGLGRFPTACTSTIREGWQTNTYG